MSDNAQNPHYDKLLALMEERAKVSAAPEELLDAIWPEIEYALALVEAYEAARKKFGLDG